MRPEVQAAVLAVLRESDRGFAVSYGSGSVHTGLGRWKRFCNWLMKKLGADQRPFTDPHNFWKVEIKPLKQVADEALINEAMRELAPEPKCRVCGSSNLDADPAGYYEHAVDYRGAPLLCLDHPEKLDKDRHDLYDQQHGIVRG